MDKLYVIKIGGNVIDDERSMQIFLNGFSQIREKKILIHGGGKISTRIADKLGVISKFVEGRRITDENSLNIATMVYGGLVNKKIIAQLHKYNCNAIGLSGADANSIQGIKRSPAPIDFGFVGDIYPKGVNVHFVSLLLDNAICPVFCAITHDNNGQLLNTNADTIAATVAIAMSKKYETHLVFCFEKDGVLENMENENSVIKEINQYVFEQLKAEKKLFSGMVPKIINALSAVQQGVKNVVIGNSNHIFDNTSDKIRGTKIY